MAQKQDRKRKAEQEDRVGRIMRHTSKKGLKKAKVWRDSKRWSDNDLDEE